jgi:hypothetical protein
MYGKYENLTVIEHDEARNDQVQGGYKYLIRNSWSAYTAYKTDKGFQDWLERANVKLELKEVNELDGKVAKVYKAHGTITEYLFWKMEEIPTNAITFKGLSNGSLVDCFYIHNENGSTIYRPNPNAKEVYKPMVLDDHISYQRVNG